MSTLDIRGLAKAFGTTAVLDGFDLHVADGSITALLGPSGSGKTTLLRLVAGFDRADAGTIRIGDQVVDDGRLHVVPERRRLGYVPQEGALFPHLTVARNVGFGVARGPERAERVGRLLDLVGLAGLDGRFPDQLSGGQRQRVALARALAVEPELVLLDEPFSALDPALRAAVRSDVQDVLRTLGATAVLVTHDQDEALSMADQVAVIREGRVVQAAPPQQLYDQPVDEHVARFLGDTNLFAATVTGGMADTPLGRVAVLTADGSAAHDGPATVLVRPEHLEVSPSGTGAASAADGTPGVVRRADFQGGVTILHVELDGWPAGDLARVHAVGGGSAAVGSTVVVSVIGSGIAWPTSAAPTS